MKHISFWVKTFEGGGAQRVIATLTQEFLRRDYAVSIVTMFHAESYALPAGVEVFVLGIDRADLTVEHNMDKLRNLERFLNDRQVDCAIICSTSAPLYRYALEMSRYRKLSIVAAMTNDPNCSPRTPMLRRERDEIFQELLRRNSGFIFQTPYERDYFGEAIAQRSVIINNPMMQLPHAPHKGKRRSVIVSAGRLDEQKNFSMLLCAFALFCEKNNAFRLELYGRGHMERQLREEAEMLGISDRVDFCGFCLDWHEKLTDSAMFVQSSDYEGVSNVMLEALCLGVPTISTDCPAYGARMFMEDGVSGLLVPVGNARALSEAMLRLATDTELAKCFSDRSAKIYDQLLPDVIAEQYLVYLQGVLDDSDETENAGGA